MYKIYMFLKIKILFSLNVKRTNKHDSLEMLIILDGKYTNTSVSQLLPCVF